MNFNGRSIISINDFTTEEILFILKTADRFLKQQHPNLLDGKIVSMLFFEPSTRTRLSFESAMHRLGGKVIGFAEPGATSVKKGENLTDTVRMAASYSDVIIIRHPLEGAARLASEVSSVPVINGGDGANQHPTQTFLDLFTVMKTQTKLFNKKGKTLNVGIAGDLKYGRTVHSLSSALARFNSRLFFISPPSLRMPGNYLNELADKGIPYSEHDTIEDVIQELDILYATRIQEERFPDPIEFMRVKNAYIIRNNHLKNAKKNLKIMHPLPRVSEIHREVDNSPCAYYFQQAANGIPVRQALLALINGKLQ